MGATYLRNRTQPHTTEKFKYSYLVVSSKNGKKRNSLRKLSGIF